MIMAICSVQEGRWRFSRAGGESGHPALIWNDAPERAQNTKRRG
jgi:hypothetical protein